MTTPYVTSRLTGWLTLDGAPLAHTGPDLAAGVPTVLSGAKVNWGRSTTVDQPGPSTAAFTVANIPGGPTGWLARLEIGARVDFWASGVLMGSAGANTITDPGFESWPLGTIRSGYPRPGALAWVITGTGVVVSAPVHGGARSVQLWAPAHGGGSSDHSQILIPPDRFSSDRTAWDHIQTMVRGDQYWISYSVRVPLGAVYEVQGYAFQSPTGSTSPAPMHGDGQVHVGTGAWETVTGQLRVAETDYGVDITGWWAGISLSWHPLAWTATPGQAGMPPGQSWTATPGTWADYGHAEVDDVAVQFATQSPTRDALTFTGRITDVTMRMDASNLVQADIIAADPLAELANVVIGDDPWPMETLLNRVSRIMGLAAAGVGYQVDPPAASRLVTWRDVDRQPVTGLIQELAASAAATGWMATHSTSGGPYFYLEDPSTSHPAVYVLQLVGGVVVIGVGTAGGFTELSATRVIRDPVRWAKSVADVTTALDLTWLEQTLDDKGQPAPTERHVTVQGSAADLSRYGYRRVSLSTQLAAQADGEQVAALLYARLAVPGWRLSGLSWDTSVGLDWTDDDTTLVLDLLDGQSRLGHPLLITDLPPWSPVTPAQLPVYVEGGTFSYQGSKSSGPGARWVLTMNASSAKGTGKSGAWTSLDPTWSWTMMDPGISWADMVGVSGPVGT